MSSSETSAGFLEKAQTFVAENKRAVLIGSAAAALAVGGGEVHGRYLYKYPPCPGRWL